MITLRNLLLGLLDELFRVVLGLYRVPHVDVDNYNDEDDASPRSATVVYAVNVKGLVEAQRTIYAQDTLQAWYQAQRTIYAQDTPYAWYQNGLRLSNDGGGVDEFCEAEVVDSEMIRGKEATGNRATRALKNWFRWKK